IGFGYASTAGNDDNSIVDTASAQGMVAVTRGTHTVTLCGYNTQGPASVFGPNIVAVFLKNAAVSADLPAEDPLELPPSDRSEPSGLRPSPPGGGLSAGAA